MIGIVRRRAISVGFMPYLEPIEKVLWDGVWHIMDLIHKASLTKTVSQVGSFYPCLVREFIVNLGRDINDPNSLDFQIVQLNIDIKLFNYRTYCELT